MNRNKLVKVEVAAQTEPIEPEVIEKFVTQTIIKEVPVPYEIIKEVTKEIVKEIPMPYEVVKYVT